MSLSRERMVEGIIHRLAAGQAEAAILAAGYEAEVIAWTRDNFADRIEQLRQHAVPAVSNVIQDVVKPATPPPAPSAAPAKKLLPVMVDCYDYQGSPVLRFANGESDRYPFSFGLTKARKLLSFLDENGPEALHTILRNFVDENSGNK